MSSSAPAYAVIVCTRNRPEDLTRALASIAAEAGPEMLVMVVDASDPAARTQNAARAETFTAAPLRYLPFPGAPSLARQRNFALDHLPPSVAIVHFLDDDVTLAPGYFHVLNAWFDHPSVGGAGGRVIEPGPPRPRRRMPLRRLFLLDHPAPGRVLPSGVTTPAQTLPLPTPRPVQWLSGCSCAYRRTLLDVHRFDDRLEGYALDEDLDLSFRLGREARLVVDPRAMLFHHVSPVGRDALERRAHDALVHRYWFLEKNLRSPLRKPAFWWSVFGKLLVAGLSSHPDARDALRGRLRAVRTLLRREHYLLRPS
ncbi:glycosyltransferase family 2 protein [Rhodocaloribacter sp.]